MNTRLCAASALAITAAAIAAIGAAALADTGPALAVSGAALTRASSAAAGTDPAAAGTDLRSIARAAEGAVRAQAGAAQSGLSLTLAPLDPRLRLPACSRPLEAFITGGGQVQYQTTVGVRCTGSVHWTIYTSVTVESLAQVLIARYALPRDAALAAADFQVQTRRVPGLLSGYLTDPAALAGQRLARPLRAGDALGIDALAPAFLIHRGQQVVLVAHSPGIDVRMAGIALADGRIADRIQVRNLSSQRVVEGVVRSDSEVEAPL
ncbi:MAG TPA: flagellar basal body P-ring formation chaperone FlgA [Steroidobacteraceae bacterium]|jgi:flagella basal body P-ring formation protein FlgA|nr:flagellar basal body P-ring formation chaperone FlgA [Steroidobacteraceae bacterium]